MEKIRKKSGEKFTSLTRFPTKLGNPHPLSFCHNFHRFQPELNHMDPPQHLAFLPTYSTAVSDGVYKFLNGAIFGSIWGMVTPFHAPGTIGAIQGEITCRITQKLMILQRA